MAKNKLAIGTFVAAVAGFVTGILLAPKSGKETREQIKQESMKAKDTAVEEVREKTEAVKEKATEVANDVSEKAKEVRDDVTAKAKDLKGSFDHKVAGVKDAVSSEPEAKKK
jgi:gas vesicle protein